MSFHDLHGCHPNLPQIQSTSKKQLTKADQLKKNPLSNLVGIYADYYLQEVQTEDGNTEFHIKHSSSLWSYCKGTNNDYNTLDTKGLVAQFMKSITPSKQLPTTTTTEKYCDHFELSLSWFRTWQEINPSHWFDDILVEYQLAIDEIDFST